MNTATLGGLIKDYRIKKRLSQIEISAAIGWRDTSRLSKIEQGRVGKPTRETVDKIIKALELTDQEKGEFLLIGGYLPTDGEINTVVKEYRERLNNWPNPAYIMDFSWRLLYSNLLNLDILNLPHSWQSEIERTHPNSLPLPFLPKKQFPVDVWKGEDAGHLQAFTIAQIASFKMETSKYDSAIWYKNLIKQLQQISDFRDLWNTVRPEDYYKKLFDYEYKRIKGVYNGVEEILEFHIQTAKIINDPRFQVVFYFPANQNTTNFIHKLASYPLK